MALEPEPLSRAQLADILGDIAAAVRDGDSLEGHIEWMLPDEPGGADCQARGAWRVGNARHGQGFMRSLGQVVPTWPPQPDRG